MGHLFVKPNQTAESIIHGYGVFVAWFHTTGLPAEMLLELLDKSLMLTKNGVDMNQHSF